MINVLRSPTPRILVSVCTVAAVLLGSASALAAETQADADLEAATQITNVFIWVGLAAMVAGYAIWWFRKKNS